MTIHIELFGSYGARHVASGLEVDFTRGVGKHKDPLGPICRLLRENGYDNEERVHVTREGTPVFARDRKLSKWADYDIYDGTNGRAYSRKHVENTEKTRDLCASEVPGG